MSSTQNGLMVALAEALFDVSRAGRGVTGHGGEYVIIHCPAGLEAVAEWLDQRHLFIPRSDLAGRHYAYQWTHDGKLRRHPVCDEDWAITKALAMRAQQQRNGQPVNAIGVSAPILPWSPIPLPEGGQR